MSLGGCGARDRIVLATMNEGRTPTCEVRWIVLARRQRYADLRIYRLLHGAAAHAPGERFILLRFLLGEAIWSVSNRQKLSALKAQDHGPRPPGALAAPTLKNRMYASPRANGARSMRSPIGWIAWLVERRHTHSWCWAPWTALPDRTGRPGAAGSRPSLAIRPNPTSRGRTSATRRSLAACSSNVSRLPATVDEKPHCGLSASRSRGMSFAAHRMRRSSLPSRSLRFANPIILPARRDNTFGGGAMSRTRALFANAIASALAMGVAVSASSAAWEPTRPIELIVPAGTGGVPTSWRAPSRASSPSTICLDNLS